MFGSVYTGATTLRSTATLTMSLRRLATLVFYTLLFSFLPRHVRGSSLTTTIGPNEKLCFYADVDKEGEKIGVSNMPRLYSITRR